MLSLAWLSKYVDYMKVYGIRSQTRRPEVLCPASFLTCVFILPMHNVCVYLSESKQAGPSLWRFWFQSAASLFSFFKLQAPVSLLLDIAASSIVLFFFFAFGCRCSQLCHPTDQQYRFFEVVGKARRTCFLPSLMFLRFWALNSGMMVASSARCSRGGGGMSVLCMDSFEVESQP